MPKDFILLKRYDFNDCGIDNAFVIGLHILKIQFLVIDVDNNGSNSAVKKGVIDATIEQRCCT